MFYNWTNPNQLWPYKAKKNFYTRNVLAPKRSMWDTNGHFSFFSSEISVLSPVMTAMCIAVLQIPKIGHKCSEIYEKLHLHN